VRGQQEQAWESERQEAIQDGMKLTGQEITTRSTIFKLVRKNTNRFCVLCECSMYEVDSARQSRARPGTLGLPQKRPDLKDFPRINP
jgi:hypothetical protein